MSQIQSIKNPSKGLKVHYYNTILKNPYIPVKPYPKQAIPIFEVIKNEQLNDKGQPEVNTVLVGAGGFGGKTYLGSMLAAQYLPEEEDYTCLVTRRNYAELVDTNSIWDNLVDWCCNEDLDENICCDFKRSPNPQIIAPNGNKIYFKAFDRGEKKQKLKSASYDRIVNDEASELPLDVIKFQYRSMRNTSWLPRSIIHLSNPSGESTDYLVEHFVDGPKPYVALDWRDNPFIDKDAYEASLDELDYIDQQYQKYGDWHYRPSKGDLINREDIESQKIGYTAKNLVYSLMSIDLAGKGRDKFAVSRIDYLRNGFEVLVDFAQTKSSMPEDMLLNFIGLHNQDKRLPLTSVVVIEQEGGGSPLYAQRYFQELLTNNGFNIPVVLKTPKGSKYQRARPVMRLIKQGLVKINNVCNHLEEFIDESIKLMPVMEKSPNLVDSVSLGHNYLHEEILGKGSSISFGGRI